LRKVTWAGRALGCAFGRVAPCAAAEFPLDDPMPSPLIEFEYRLQGGAARWGLWAGALLLAACLLVSGGARLRDLDGQLDALRGRLDQVREQTAASSASLQTLAAPVPPDFTAGLPGEPPVADVVQMLSRACAQAGVTLAGLQATHRPASVAQLGRTELTVLVRGPYPGARAALDAVLQRYPAVTVQRLRMRRTSSPADLETSATLSVWGRPAQGEPAVAAGRPS
jgi:hypothetical protein